MEILKTLGTELLAFINNTKDFLVDQIPDVLQQILYWEAAQAGLTILYCLIAIGTFALFYRWLVPMVKNEDFKAPLVLLRLVLFVAVFFATLPAQEASQRLLKVVVAPKLVLIDKAKELITEATKK